ncbi:hypothetical protein [Myroides odoratimimus]|uniref:hypothetical protein n=1 Tax=Myroides odoratimimus TaxID=76832 RepID=UPI001CE1A2B8|nr:hypothetical protein [Myroides odoratimimus]MCA4807004.1 hypothetical protein [Myroides odoratimimus]
MKTKIKLISYLLLSSFLLACQENKPLTSIEPEQTSCQENLDGSITIQGKITLKGSQKAPLGVTSMNISNKWSFSKDLSKFVKQGSSTKKTIAFGENKRVFVDKNGYYKITISKNDTLMLIPTPYLYKQPKQITGLTKSQILNIELESLPLEVVRDLEKRDTYAYTTFYNYLQKVNPDSIITVSGTIYKANTKEALENIYIVSNFSNNTMGAATHHLTDKYGQFTIKTPKNSSLLINGISQNKFYLTPKNDTIINLYL